MAAPNTTLKHSASPLASQTVPAATSGGAAKKLLEERLLTHGVVLGQHVQDAGYYEATVAAGAPGTTDVDLLSSLDPIGNPGGSVHAVVGTLVYLEVVRLTGADLRIRKSAANAVGLLSGVTDTLDVPGGHAVLLDCLPSSSTRTTSGLAFDATHKQLQLESTAGCTVAILAAVI